MSADRGDRDARGRTGIRPYIHRLVALSRSILAMQESKKESIKGWSVARRREHNILAVIRKERVGSMDSMPL